MPSHVPNWTLQYGPRRHPLGSAPLVIGRSDEADVQIDDPSASRRHARVLVGDHGPVVEDLGSRHGLLVDGEQLAPRGRKPLAHGTRLVIGTHQMLVQDVARLKLELAPTMEQRRPRAQRPSLQPRPDTGEVDPIAGLMNDVEAAMLLGPESKLLGLVRALLVNLDSRKRALEEPVLDRAASVVLRVAASTSQPQFVDDVVQLLSYRAWLMPPSALDELEAALARGPTLRTLALRAYAERMRVHFESHPLDPDQRSELDRLVRLVR